MSNWLNSDNVFFSFMSKVFDILVLNLLWLVCCVPIVTIIPATTALYYAVVKAVRRGRGYAAKEFFRSFRLNLKPGIVFSVFAFVAAFVLYIDFQYAYSLLQEQESTGTVFLGIFIVAAFLFCALFIYICPVLSRFDMKLSGIIKTSFVLTIKHFLTTIGLLAILAVVVLGCYIFTQGLLFLPATGVMTASFLMERVFKKYMPAKEAVPGDDTQEKDEWYLE